jgi:hypothetical protein
MPPTNRRQRTHRVSDLPDGPRSFKERLASAKRIAEASDDGHREVVKDDRLDYCGLPTLVNKWEIKPEDTTYNHKTHARVWCEVEVPDQPEPARIRFWDHGGRLGDQLLEFERCGTRGNVVGMLDAREYDFGGGVGYEFFLADLPEEAPALETHTEDAPGY